MECKNLESIDLEELLSVFNTSFSDYLIPFHLTLEQLKSKIETEKIEISLSVGGFEAGQLVSFILHAEKIENGKRMVYNAGTGVVQEYRGQGLVRRMYDHILPVLKDRKTDILMLEVLEENQIAIRAYTNLGFTISRKLLCFKGNIEPKEKDTDVLIEEIERFEWDTFKSFWDIETSWQNSVIVLEQMRKDCLILGAYQADELVGYAIYNPTTKKVHQIAVDQKYRRKGIATKLFEVINQKVEGQPISINNVDDSSESSHAFLTKIGLENWISQFEMVHHLQPLV